MSYQISVQDVPGKESAKVVFLSGEIDESSLDGFKQEFEPLLQTPNISCYILQIEKLEFINSQTIGYFAGVYSDLHSQNKKLLLAQGNEHILDILTLVGFTNLVEHFSTLDEAVSAV